MIYFASIKALGGLGAGRGIRNLETRAGSGKLLLMRMLSGCLESTKLCSLCVNTRQASYWHQCELEFAGIHAEIQVVGMVV